MSHVDILLCTPVFLLQLFYLLCGVLSFEDETGCDALKMLWHRKILGH